MIDPPKTLVCVVLAALVGCTTMQPVAAPRSVEQGTPVRVNLLEGQDIELASLTVRNVTQIEGRLTGWSSSDQALILSSRVTTGGGVPQETQSETIRVLQGNIASFEAEATDGTKTTVLAAIGGAIVVGVLVAIASKGNSGDPGGQGPGGNPTRTGGFPIPIKIP